MCVCTRSRVVAAAANDSATNGSSAWCPPPSSHLMSGAGWSVTKQASKPASSATRAHSITASPVTNSSAWATWSVGNPIVKRIGRILRTSPSNLRPCGRRRLPKRRKFGDVGMFARMTTIYYERDADLAALTGERVAVVGYGNQGRSWALNLRDSGCDPVVCVRRDAARAHAEADAVEANDLQAANAADVICLLVPDALLPLLPLAPKADSSVAVARGYTLGFGRLAPPGASGMVAPRMLGP